MKLIYKVSIGFLLLAASASAQKKQEQAAVEISGLRAIGSPSNPKVAMNWNRYHDTKQIQQFCADLQKAYPDLVRYESIGKSYEGRDILVLTISDFSAGKVDRKPGLWIDGNIHANELQGSEIAMYTAWYLAENYQAVPFIKELLQDKVFYIAPTINPDSRDYFIHEPNTMHSSRTGRRPFDNDGDGLVNEDLYDDLDGDGQIVMMRRKSKTGRYKVDPDYPNKMVLAKPGEVGEYEMLGFEGIDNDGDGLVNEDITGTYDPNRDWGWNWQPNYVQNGALYYPGTLPETQAVKKFFYAHTNIAGAQSYHNYGGMILRGPGAAEDDKYYSRKDIQVYDALGKVGEKMLPGYNYIVIHKDLYTVFGGEIDFFALARGVYTFSNELMTTYKLFNEKSPSGLRQSDEYYEFDKLLLFGDAYVPWTAYDHPQFGKIEIGGPKKNYTRNHPGFLLLEDAHRNAAFTIYHAHHTPKLEILETDIKPLNGNLFEVNATIWNSRIIPTHSDHDVSNKIVRPDHIRLEGADVLVGMRVIDKDFNVTTEQKYKPYQIEVPTIDGMGSVNVRWIVKGNPAKAKLVVDSEKGGLVEQALSVN
ncbi:M14 family metallopeptidase [Sphingobacterium oryzagri]|uniref:M14 family metallopeptidase n=1 Tax=Sphingobacterium oryzagri TaxID=3025669 RepID=A0ABY7WKY1_9SPHI|nr:M14 family metallopeptidase [Sphingobacterium sp. KACC 22765]WDF69058.1 M14 family metallopeptidase [Sphingobacterium sp. KACC 22765]